MLAPGGVIERDPHDHGADDEIEEGHRDLAELACRDGQEQLLVRTGRKSAAPLGRHIDKAPHHGERPERRHEGTELELGNGQAVEQAHKGRRKQTCDQRDQERTAREGVEASRIQAIHGQRGDRGRKGNGRAHGQVDPSGNDHQRYAQRGYGNEREIAGDIGDVAGGKKVGRQEAHHDDEHHQRRQHIGGLAGQEAALPETGAANIGERCAVGV